MGFSLPHLEVTRVIFACVSLAGTGQGPKAGAWEAVLLHVASGAVSTPPCRAVGPKPSAPGGGDVCSPRPPQHCVLTLWNSLPSGQVISGVSRLLSLSFSQVQQSSFYGYTGMLPKRYTQGVMTGESEYLQTPGGGGTGPPGF